MNVAVWFYVMCNVTDIYQRFGEPTEPFPTFIVQYKSGKWCRVFYRKFEWKNLRTPRVSNPWARLETPTFWMRITFNQTYQRNFELCSEQGPSKAKLSVRMNEENVNPLKASYNSVYSLLTSHLVSKVVTTKIWTAAILCVCVCMCVFLKAWNLIL
jgi:hypothetical protein